MARIKSSNQPPRGLHFFLRDMSRQPFLSHSQQFKTSNWLNQWINKHPFVVFLFCILCVLVIHPQLILESSLDFTPPSTILVTILNAMDMIMLKKLFTIFTLFRESLALSYISFWQPILLYSLSLSSVVSLELSVEPTPSDTPMGCQWVWNWTVWNSS